MAKDPNLVTIRGRLTRDPEIRSTRGGRSVASLGIASNGRTRTSDGQWQDDEPTYWECEAWRALADNIPASLTKGTPVIALARPRANVFDDRNGTHRRTIRWVLEAIGPDLSHGTCRFQRTPAGNGRPDPMPADGGPAPDAYETAAAQDDMYPPAPEDPWN